MEELLRELTLDISSGTYTNGIFEATLLNSDEYSSVYYNLEDLSDFELDEEKLLVDENMNYIVYNSDEYQVILTGNFDKDEYRITVKEK